MHSSEHNDPLPAAAATAGLAPLAAPAAAPAVLLVPLHVDALPVAALEAGLARWEWRDGADAALTGLPSGAADANAAFASGVAVGIIGLVPGVTGAGLAVLHLTRIGAGWAPR